jgi:NAD(P)-dependent dehydrogenase (short-subunit alcohol dehydrogenase family)
MSGSSLDEAMDMRSRVCLITGGTGGIGKQTALGLAQLGATVVVHGRNRERAESTLTEIRKQTGNDNVELLLADLASLEDVRRLASDFLTTHNQLHVLINNAGIVTSRRELTQDHLERTMAINHFAPFLLTNLLLETLKASATPNHTARVVTVSSDAHHAGRINPDDLNYTQRYCGMRAYCDSKLANILFTYELARRLGPPDGTHKRHVTATCVHPGSVATAWGHGIGGPLGLGWRLFSLFMLSPRRGALPTLRAATLPALEGVSGIYLTQKGITRSSAASYNVETARRLWEESARLTGVTPDSPPR